MSFSLSMIAVDQTRNTSKAQTWMFVMSSRKQNAFVAEAYIAADVAKRRARALGSCVRIGRVVAGQAETF